MHLNWFNRAIFITALGATTALGVAAPSWATSDIPINPGNVPTKAKQAEQECSPNLGGGPYPDKDVWVFNLPGNHDQTGDFVFIVAKFDTNGDGKADTSVTIEDGASDGDDIVLLGHSKAWVVTPAGWTLITATARITGTAPRFVLTHTCAAHDGTPTPGPTPSESDTEKPTDKPTGKPGESPGGGGGLPVTGTPVGVILLVGLGLVAGGGALIAVRRRRDIFSS